MNIKFIHFCLFSFFFFFISDFDDYYDEYGDFDSGWTWVGRKRDISDLEWRVWLALVWRLIPCVFVHNFVSQYIKVNSSKTTVRHLYFYPKTVSFSSV